MKKIATVVLLVAGVLAASGCAGTTPISVKAEVLVDKARWTVESFKQRQDQQMEMFRKFLNEAQGVVIFPGAYKAGFILGAEYGDGVLLARTASGEWSPPAFYTMGAGSIGLQIGGQVAETVLVVRSRGAVEAIVEHQGKLGADIEITLGTVGGGIEGAVTSNLGADIIVFSHSAGLYAGGSLEGAVLARRNDYNQAFYGSGATPQAILFGQGFANPHADGLRGSLLLN
ncbi:MAG: lipid-binding SYLF domain-containing protein [Rhodospirillales bacterium]|nr:lipid-binding SYLF domain-containing protein [Rhodospirillales bacterium]